MNITLKKMHNIFISLGSNLDNPQQQIKDAFQSDDLLVYTNPSEFKDFLFSQKFNNTSLLLMSSGNYGGLNFDELKQLF